MLYESEKYDCVWCDHVDIDGCCTVKNKPISELCVDGNYTHPCYKEVHIEEVKCKDCDFNGNCILEVADRERVEGVKCPIFEPVSEPTI